MVFFKSPNTRAEVLGTRRFIIAVCGTITIAIALALYVAHGVTLTRRGHFRSRAGEAAASAVIEEAGGSP